MAIIKPVILEGGQLKTAGVGDQVPQSFVEGLESSLESKASKTELTTGLGLKVDKVAGKGLSDTNFTQTEKTKLAGIASAATKNRTDSENADKVHTHTMDQVTGLTTTLAGKADKTTQVIAGTGLSGGGSLEADRTLSVNYGTAAGTAAQGNDSRLSNSREWTAETITQAEAEAGTASTRRAFTAQRVRQATVAWFNGISGALGRTILTRTTTAQVRGDIGLGAVDNTSDADKPVSTAVADGLALKVDKVTGKGLSETDYTTAEKTKLAGIQAGAQVNAVTSVSGRSGAVTLAKGDVGLANVDNTSDDNKPLSTAASSALSSKVDKVAGKGLSETDYTQVEKTKLAGIAAGATKNRADSANADKAHTHTTAQVTGLDTALGSKASKTELTDGLALKVDKVAGKGLSDTNFTQSEKDKLSSLEGSKFVGLFVSESALPATGSAGDYANVDGGVGSNVYRVIWDSSDSRWEKLQGVSTDFTPAQIKQQYESNPDTNAFTDDEKAKLSTVANGATVNRSDSLNSDKVHTHTWSQVTGQPAQATRWPTFAEVTGKPTTFAPSSHTHPWAEVTGQPATATRWPTFAEVTGKPTNYATTWASVAAIPATATRWPTFAEVTGKPTTFEPSAHTHAWSQVTGQPATATRWPTFAEVSGKPATYAPSRSTNTVEGGIKTRISGSTLWMTNNGNNA